MRAYLSCGVRALLALALSCGGCAHYVPRPLSPEGAAAAFDERSLADPAIRELWLASHLPAPETWPPDAWGLEALMLAALAFHPALAEARARLAVARAGLVGARQRANPTLAISPAYNVTTLPAWILGVGLEAPLPVPGVRGHRMARAEHEERAAQLRLSARAWAVRTALHSSLLELHAATRERDALAHRGQLQEQNVRLLQAIVAEGALVPIAVTRERIALNETWVALRKARLRVAEARVALAGAIGVPTGALDSIELDLSPFERPVPAVDVQAARHQAALHRSDLLAALADFAASQETLQIEIARQFPSIRIGPGYELDQGEHKWSLGLTIELPVLNRNQGPIAVAEASREAAAARFVALQARVFNEVELAAAACEVLRQEVADTEDLVDALNVRARTIRAMYDAGGVSRQQVLTAELEQSVGQLTALRAGVDLWRAFGRLEATVQAKPPFSDSLPDRAAPPASDRAEEHPG